MNKKILAFIYNKRKKKFLILKTGDSDEKIHGKSKWFTTTGSVENKESYETAVKREVLEETGLIVKEVYDLKWGCRYKWQNRIHEELYSVAFIDSDKVKLDNVEVIDSKWLSLSKFVDLLSWDDDKELLRKVLEKALDKKQYFKKQEIKDYRKNERI